jgi:hypothetical protein
MSKGTSQGLPTAFSGSAGSIMTDTGLSGISFPDFLIWIKCSPGPLGTNVMPGKRKKKAKIKT